MASQDDWMKSANINTNSSGYVNSAGNQGYTFGNADDYMKWLIDSASQGDQAAQDKLGSYYLGEQSNKIARDWTAAREDTAVQRFAQDARNAGFNPMALLNLGTNPISSSSSGHSYSGTNFESKRHNEVLEGEKAATLAVSLVSTVAIIALSLL